MLLHELENTTNIAKNMLTQEIFHQVLLKMLFHLLKEFLEIDLIHLFTKQQILRLLLTLQAKLLQLYQNDRRIRKCI